MSAGLKLSHVGQTPFHLCKSGAGGAQTIPKGYARGDDLGGLARVESVVLLIYIDSTS